MIMRYIATVGEHINHIFRGDNLILPKGVDVSLVDNAILLFAYSKLAQEQDYFKIKESIETARVLFDRLNIACITKEITNPYEFTQNVMMLRGLFTRETIVNITGGRRIIGYSLFYAAVLEKNSPGGKKRNFRVFYVPEEGNVIELPLIAPQEQISHLEEEILNLLETPLSIKEIACKINKGVSLVSQYLSMMESKGYVRKVRKGRHVIVYKVI
ncbi:MAG: CRISPR-associated CARF protein Csa3 [Candidatus Korarchaeota archaeon]